MTVGDFRELRLLVDLGGDLRKIAKVVFSKSDASLYLFPYAPSGRYYFGGRHMDEVEFEDKIKSCLEYRTILVLGVGADKAQAATQALCKRFGLKARSFDKLFLDALKKTVEDMQRSMYVPPVVVAPAIEEDEGSADIPDEE